MAVAIVQARMSSKRLPGKVLMPILEKPMISLLLERLTRATLLSDIIVATSNDFTDDILAKEIKDLGFQVYRGSLSNVGSRYLEIIQERKIETVVRITGDCPVVDHKLVDRIIHFYLDGNYHYASNTLTRTFPRGLDVEIFNASSYVEFSRDNKLSDYDNEHVTPIFYQNPRIFRLGNFMNDADFSSQRWTVDNAADFKFISEVFENLYVANPDFDFKDICELVQKNPSISNFELDH
jgi:spore coat polysaccharide biosynthesis protein SpsF